MTDENKSSDVPVDEIVELASKLKDKGIVLRELNITTQVGQLAHSITCVFDGEDYEVREDSGGNIDISYMDPRGTN